MIPLMWREVILSENNTIELRFSHLKVHSTRYLNFWLPYRTNVMSTQLLAVICNECTWRHVPATRVLAAGEPLDVHGDVLRGGRVVIGRLAHC